MRKTMLFFCVLLGFAVSTVNAQVKDGLPDPIATLGNISIRNTTATVKQILTNRKVMMNRSDFEVRKFEVSIVFKNKNGEDQYYGPFTIKNSAALPDNIYQLIEEHPDALKKIYIEGIEVYGPSKERRLLNPVILTIIK